MKKQIVLLALVVVALACSNDSTSPTSVSPDPTA
jgi:ABC-type glycerol-3-phosphate transport system substrate-binding protein